MALWKRQSGLLQLSNPVTAGDGRGGFSPPSLFIPVKEHLQPLQSTWLRTVDARGTSRSSEQESRVQVSGSAETSGESYNVKGCMSTQFPRTNGKYPRHREPLLKSLKCLGKVWKEGLREMVKKARAGGLGGKAPCSGSPKKVDTWRPSSQACLSQSTQGQKEQPCVHTDITP